MINSYTKNEQYYGDYLALEKILNAQHLESKARGVDAHDEMLFIIIHQTYELWFKQIIYELNSVMDIFREKRINDNSAALQTATHRMGRIGEIFKILVQQMSVMETMTAMDFLDFRDLLTPASGFQSFQFRVLEAMLGLRMNERHQVGYYEHQLRLEHIQAIRLAENQTSLFELLDRWLERIPFWEVEKYWGEFTVPEGAKTDIHPFWATYRHIFEGNLQGEERQNIAMEQFDALFLADGDAPNRHCRLSAASCRAALFINVYREYPLLQLPFQLLSQLLDLDAQMASWRQRHLAMVRRIIGLRAGTGGSSGADYLKGALDKHHVFGDIAQLATYLIPRHSRPILPTELERRLRFYDL